MENPIKHDINFILISFNVHQSHGKSEKKAIKQNLIKIWKSLW